MNTQAESLSLNEVIQLGAVDTSFFNTHFFPKAFRQAVPQLHREMDKVLDAQPRLAAFKMFRGAAKTTKLRAFAAKRLSYGLSQLGLIVSETEGHSLYTIDWLKNQVVNNKPWASAFGLRKGAKWDNTEIEVINGVLGTRTRFVAKGILGQVRGFNFDDFRPDFILLDDVCNEDNTRTPENRTKIQELIMGALVNSLAAPGDCEHAMMVMAQTPLNAEDAIELACKDPAWVSLVAGCFDTRGESRWPEMFPTEYLLAKKAEATAKNQLSIWMREMECTITSKETALFDINWLQYWDTLPEGGFYLIGLDPTPPPREGAPITKDRDDAALVLWYICEGKRFLVDRYTTKSPSMEELSNKFFEFVLRARPLQAAVVETQLYQRVLKKHLEDEMLRRGMFITILPYEDRRKKCDRINQAITNAAYNRRIFVHASQSDWISQYTDYPDVAHDDLLDATAIAFSAINPAVEGVTVDGSALMAGMRMEKLPNWRSAP